MFFGGRELPTHKSGSPSHPLTFARLTGLALAPVRGTPACLCLPAPIPPPCRESGEGRAGIRRAQLRVAGLRARDPLAPLGPQHLKFSVDFVPFKIILSFFFLTYMVFGGGQP